MSREFGTSGEEHAKRDPKDGAAQPSKEILGGKVGREPLSSPRITYTRCVEAISRLPEHIQQGVSPTRIDELSQVYLLQGNAAAIRKLGEGFESRKDPKDDEVYHHGEVGSIYWRAAYLGDEIAGNRLHHLLQQEKNGALSEGDKRIPSESKLVSVVAACAKNDVPADAWIERYTLNPDTSARLKLKYWWESEDANTETRDTALRYREELTDQYLHGKALTKMFAFRKAEFLLGIQESVETKRKIFERFQELPSQLQAEGEGFDTQTLSYLCNFAKSYLDDEGVARPQDVAWIEDNVEKLSGALNLAGHDPYTVSAFTRFTKDSLDRYYEQDKEILIEKLDARTGEQALLDQEHGTLDDATEHRESRLYDLAKDALASEDISAARTYITALGEDTAMNTASAKKLFDSIKTMEQLEAIKPDDMELLFKENLATFFETKRILLGDNVDDLENLVIRSETTSVKRPLTIKENIQKYAIERLYKVDADRGQEITSALIADAPDFDTAFEIAKNQIANGDVTGWETMSNKIRPDDLSAYTKLALYAAKAMKKD